MGKPRVLIFASGDLEGGGSGFEMLAHFARTHPAILDAEIVGVVSDHENGGVRRRADNLGIPFFYMLGPFTVEAYQKIYQSFGEPWVMLSGWLKFVRGLPVERVVNIHPGPLPDFGGDGMHGHAVHDAVMFARLNGEILQSAVCMHFVDPHFEYDTGPVFFSLPVLIMPEDTPDSLGARVNKFEHGWQAFMLNLVVHKAIWLEDEPDCWIIHYPVVFGDYFPWLREGDYLVVPKPKV